VVTVCIAKNGGTPNIKQEPSFPRRLESTFIKPPSFLTNPPILDVVLNMLELSWPIPLIHLPLPLHKENGFPPARE